MKARLLIALLLAGAVSGAEKWELPRGVFPHEIAVLSDEIHVASTEGLWHLEKDGRVRRVGEARAASWPVAVGADRLWWVQQDREVEYRPATGRIRAVPSLHGKAVAVFGQRYGLLFADDGDGTWFSADGESWNGPIAGTQHAFALDRLGDEWWAVANLDREDADKFTLSRSTDLRTWRPAAEFTGNQVGSLAAGAGVIVITEIAGVRVYDPRELPRSALVAVGPADERPAVYFEHGYFWLQGERDGLWRSADGLGWQNLQSVLAPLGAPLVQVGFAPDALVLAGYTGRVIRVPLAALPPSLIHP